MPYILYVLNIIFYALYILYIMYYKTYNYNIMAPHCIAPCIALLRLMFSGSSSPKSPCETQARSPLPQPVTTDNDGHPCWLRRARIKNAIKKYTVGRRHGLWKPAQITGKHLCGPNLRTKTSATFTITRKTVCKEKMQRYICRMCTSLQRNPKP